MADKKVVKKLESTQKDLIKIAELVAKLQVKVDDMLAGLVE